MRYSWAELTQKHNPTVHFIGIGGIGMSALAYYALHNGMKVQGSTLVGDAFILEQLQKKGGKVFYAHSTELIHDDVDYVVTTTGIPAHNPELQEAERRGIPIFHRSDFLRMILEHKKVLAVSGSHGKTTTTALLGAVLDHGKMDPTIFCGGIINAYKHNVRIGESPWAVVEADESDKKSLVNFESIWGSIVTNIAAEHMENYTSFDDLLANFYAFISKASHHVILCWDNEHIRALAETHNLTHKPTCVSYGFHPDALVRGQNVRCQKDGNVFDIFFQTCSTHWKDIYLPLKGHHNVSNAIAVAAMGKRLGISEEKVKEAFLHFQGVHRRLTLVGTSNGITVFDDYAHHPSEIHITLQGVRATLSPQQKIIAICQPHRYTRVHAHMDAFARCFSHADVTVILPLYSANEAEIPNVNSAVLWNKLCQNGTKAFFQEDDSPEGLAACVLHHATAGDVVVCMGAGSITSIAHALPHSMENQSQKGGEAHYGS